MVTRTGGEPDKGRRVTLVQVIIQVYPHADDGNHFEKVYVQVMRLGPVGLPEL